MYEVLPKMNWAEYLSRKPEVFIRYVCHLYNLKKKDCKLSESPLWQDFGLERNQNLRLHMKLYCKHYITPNNSIPNDTYLFFLLFYKEFMKSSFSGVQLFIQQ